MAPIRHERAVEVGTVWPTELGKKGEMMCVCHHKGITMGKVPFQKWRTVDTAMRPNSSETNLKKKSNPVLGNRWTTENYLWSNSLHHSVYVNPYILWTNPHFPDYTIIWILVKTRIWGKLYQFCHFLIYKALHFWSGGEIRLMCSW